MKKSVDANQNPKMPKSTPSIISAKLFLCKMLVVFVEVKKFNSKIGITKGSETHLPVFLFPDKVDMDWGVAICWLKFPGTLSLVDALNNQNCTHTHTHMKLLSENPARALASPCSNPRGNRIHQGKKGKRL
jgi:hypothetical protein